ncbi:nectin-4-like [Fundulus heteroclitus]|uniref:nectin-4-like n=1 Tax=Fundulus heteroclitus TaxID=8078 RepID=UPI00165AD517|nr:nectin-4-like [Fundulus heteroclitus]
MAASTLLQLLVLVLVSGGSSGSDIPSQRTITATPGQNIVLTCHTRSRTAVSAVDWTRRDLGSERVFLLQDSRFETFNQHELFQNRVELRDREKNDGDVSLVLKNVTAADRGTYECRVFQSGTTNTTSPICIINLNIAINSGVNRRHEAGPPGLLMGLTVYLYLIVRFWFCDF